MLRRICAVTMTTLLIGATAAAPATAGVVESTTTIESTVVDAETGEPVAGVCVLAGTPHHIRIPDGCRSMSDETGSVTIEVAEGGTYQLLAWPNEAHGYGAQWVGVNGGTGTQLQAARVRVPDGGTASGPLVRMDPAGTVTGTVTDSDGAAVPFGQVVAIQEFLSLGQHHGWAPIEDGHYTFDELGPYDWPLLFRAGDDPDQWSGQAVNRHLAEGITVRAGETVTYDYQLITGTSVTISEDDAPEAMFATALNAQSGDRVGGWFLDPDFGIWTTQLLGAQPVKIQLRSGPDEGFVGGDDFASATTFVISLHRDGH